VFLCPAHECIHAGPYADLSLCSSENPSSVNIHVNHHTLKIMSSFALHQKKHRHVCVHARVRVRDRDSGKDSHKGDGERKE